ncbi:hypothetical protein N0B28_06780 [Pseudomonas sp. SD17-1]|uniref:hypothetical protein n=1 Tax=Pseudomonas sp. SD17-1 TaxID=2976883 RepID=UPI0023DB49C0|nr:hypothetical protein [Pseudomonas sp. SD17-1]WEJ22984.1 hypothetical protein N0B28_06780 [Pseudomonas sp. SD17-1]
MNAFVIPFAQQDLLHQVLAAGGVTSCPLYRPAVQFDAEIEVELSDEHAHIKVAFRELSGSLTLPRSDRANHLHLREFIQDVANERTEAGRTQRAIALMEALDHVDTVLQPGQVAYITPTISAVHPFGAVVTNGLGEVCAAAMGSSKEHLAELISRKLQRYPEGTGERA